MLSFSFISITVHIRLTRSSLAFAGRVEISKDGDTWGIICDKDWDLNDGHVICRQLEYSFAKAAVSMAGLVRALVQYFSEILIVEEVSRQYYSVIAATGSISHVIIAWTLGSFALHQALGRISISSLLSICFFCFLLWKCFEIFRFLATNQTVHIILIAIPAQITLSGKIDISLMCIFWGYQ